MTSHADAGPHTVPHDAQLYVGPVGRPDEYLLVGKSRRGGEGIVWKAHYQIGLPSPIQFAVKRLVPPAGFGATDWPSGWLSDRWNQQLKLLHVINHPHLAGYKELFCGWPPHPMGTTTGEPPPELRAWYLVMSWEEGPNLSKVITSQEVPLAQRIEYVVQIAQALEYLHSGAATNGMGLLHRDVKPSNIIISDMRGAVLVDFGLLRVADSNMTEIHAATGNYLAPEVHADRTKTSRASDLWALAGVAYYVVTGEDPSPFDPPGLMSHRLLSVLESTVPDPNATSGIVMQVLSGLPQDRPKSTSEWALRLQRSVSAESTGRPPLALQLPHQPSATARRRRVSARLFVGVLAVGVVVAVSVFAIRLFGGNGNPASATSALSPNQPMLISTDKTLSGNIFADDLTIDPGVTVTTNGFGIFCTGTFTNDGVIDTGAAPHGGYPRSFGGSGGGGASAGTGNGMPGYSTLAPGGTAGINYGAAGGNGSTPAAPTLTGSLLKTWKQNGLKEYLTGASGGQGHARQTAGQIGSPGAYGIVIEGHKVVAGSIDASGSAGVYSGSAGSGGGGGGGAIVIVYGPGGYEPGSYEVSGGAGSVNSGAGGAGQVITLGTGGGGTQPPITSTTTSTTSPPTRGSSSSSLQSLGTPSITQALSVSCETYTAAPPAELSVGSTDYTRGFQLLAACGGGNSTFTWNLGGRYSWFETDVALDSTVNPGCDGEELQVLADGHPLQISGGGATSTEVALSQSITSFSVDVTGQTTLGIELSANTCSGNVTVDFINDALSFNDALS
jgi:serine/threonine protein kinase